MIAAHRRQLAGNPTDNEREDAVYRRVPRGQFVHHCARYFQVEDAVVERGLASLGLTAAPERAEDRLLVFRLFEAYREVLFRRLEPVIQPWEVARFRDPDSHVIYVGEN